MRGRGKAGWRSGVRSRSSVRSLPGGGVPLLVALCGCAAACGGGAPPPEDPERPAGAEALAPSEEAEEASAAAGTPGPAAGPLPILPADTLHPLRSYALLLVNGGPGPAVVYADAGAGRVLLDTVAGADSVRVNVRVRATRLRLEAADRWGEPLGAGAVELVADSVARWSVPPRIGSP